jgi:ribosome-associated protein YbcJ (S4-like RNA binding protein)
MADPSIVREWLDKADEDFRFAEANLREGSEFYAQICFHFQQAAEKYLKAFIIDNGNMVDSGGEAKYVISEGHVRINGKVETRKRKKIFFGNVVDTTDRDVVEFGKVKIRIQVKKE